MLIPKDRGVGLRKRITMFLSLAFSALLAGCDAPAKADGELVLAKDSPPNRRCVECGWIESSRAVPVDADNRAVRIVEYTMRMGDGSSRVFNGSGEHWRVGERLMLIEALGARPVAAQ